MYCPSCKEITKCKAIPAAKVTLNARDYAQRMYYVKHKDVHYFQRGRECLTCMNAFVSAEVDLAFIEELIELRNALSTIKLNAETYIEQSAAASASLSMLSESLEVLRALKIYKTARKA